MGLGAVIGGLLGSLPSLAGGFVAWCLVQLLAANPGGWPLRPFLLVPAAIGGIIGASFGLVHGSEAGWREEPLLRSILGRTWESIIKFIPHATLVLRPRDDNKVAPFSVVESSADAPPTTNGPLTGSGTGGRPDEEWEVAVDAQTPACGGRLELSWTREDGTTCPVVIKIPPGLPDGARLRLRGLGIAGADVYVRLRLRGGPG
jgi:hypothetical protein